ERVWDAQPADPIEGDDLLLVVGRRAAVVTAAHDLGPEADTPNVFAMPLVRREVGVGASQAVGRTVRELRQLAPLDIQRGVFISRVRRLGHDIPVLPETKIERGDLVELYGAERAVRHAAPELGRLIEPTDKTDFIMVGVGVLAGILIGLLGVTIADVRISLGS